MKDFKSVVLTMLPLWVLEWLLTFFAKVQLYILVAKGIIVKQQEDITKKHKRSKSKLKRKKKLIVEGVSALPHAHTHTHAHTLAPHITARRFSHHGPLLTPAGFHLPVRMHRERRVSEANAGLLSHVGLPVIPATSIDHDTPSSEQPLDESILFEANEQHRKEFEEFLRSVKDFKDVQNWLKNFSKDSTRKYAILKLSRRILETDYGIEQAGATLAYMFKFGLFPIAVHGGFNELTRDSCSEVIARRRNYSTQLKLAIRRAGVGATIITADTCKIEPHIHKVESFSDLTGSAGGYVSTDLKGGLSMRVKSVDHNVFTAYLERGKIPIWDGVAETEDGVGVPLNGDVTVVELARLLQPYRIIFACNEGCILDKDHKAIPIVYMDKDYDDLMHADWVTERRKEQLLQLKKIVEVIPSSTSVVVTSMDNVTLQLLSPRVCGETVVKRRQDMVVHLIEDIEDLDSHKLCALMEDSFGRPLAPNYFEYLKENLYRVYLITGAEGEYNGCAVVLEANAHGFYYLCKFCVRKAAQGLGLGDLLWRCLQRDIEKLYWRSRNNNPLNSWYSARCQGSFRTNEHFTVFWYGDDNFEGGLHLIEEAISKPVTVLPLVPTPVNA